MTVFHEIELLPIAYLMVLMWVVCAGVLAKLLGNALIEATPDALRPLLATPVPLRMTGDGMVFHIFEKRLVSNLNVHLLFTQLGDFVKWLGIASLIPLSMDALVVQKNLYPEQYWSGCPPNVA